jgi:plasmid stabilization system protein ParE
MSEGQGFVLHPQAAQDITAIWEFLAEANPQAARRVREDILDRYPRAGAFSPPRPPAY